MQPNAVKMVPRVSCAFLMCSHSFSRERCVAIHFYVEQSQGFTWDLGIVCQYSITLIINLSRSICVDGLRILPRL